MIDLICPNCKHQAKYSEGALAKDDEPDRFFRFSIGYRSVAPKDTWYGLNWTRTMYGCPVCNMVFMEPFRKKEGEDEARSASQKSS